MSIIKKRPLIKRPFCFVCAFLSLGALAILDNSVMGRIMAYVRGIAGTIALPLETVMLPLFASEMFGDKSFIKVVGVFSAVNTAGLALGAPFANMCFDLFGGYNVAFIVFAFFMLFAIVVMNLCINSANRDKKKILDTIERQKAKKSVAVAE